MRLWAAAQAKCLCTNWNMKMFFKVVFNDVNHCLEQLQELRVPVLVPAESQEVLVQVCVALRAKLVSEVKVNITKLKVTLLPCPDVEPISRTKIILKSVHLANVHRVHRCVGLSVSDDKLGNANAMLSGGSTLAK